ncbi:MAG: hypothetical protein Q7K16_02365 [Candidatus Azambacteria bacterium]|nr:hypothetical protein [Candidatus Azambacteria bacterium]
MNSDELQIEKIKMHMETLRQIIWSRYNIIFMTSTLAAAILVVATFNPQLICLSLHTTKILVVILLALIPITLIDYSLKLSRDANHVMVAINTKWENKKGLFQKIWDGSSYIYVGIISLLITFVIFSILKTL